MQVRFPLRRCPAFSGRCHTPFVVCWRIMACRPKFAVVRQYAVGRLSAVTVRCVAESGFAVGRRSLICAGVCSSVSAGCMIGTGGRRGGGRWFVRDGVCGKRGRLRYALRTAFPVSSAGAGGGAYGKWSGGCSVRIAVRDELVRKTMRFAGRVRCRTGCAGILPSRRASRQGSQPMRSSPRCASRQAVSPA